MSKRDTILLLDDMLQSALKIQESYRAWIIIHL